MIAELGFLIGFFIIQIVIVWGVFVMEVGYSIRTKTFRTKKQFWLWHIPFYYIYAGIKHLIQMIKKGLKELEAE